MDVETEMSVLFTETNPRLIIIVLAGVVIAGSIIQEICIIINRNTGNGQNQEIADE